MEQIKSPSKFEQKFIEQTKKEKKKILQGYLCVFGAICIHLAIGSFYIWGNVSLYVVSYLILQKNEIKPADAVIIIPLNLIVSVVLGPFTAQLARLYNIRILQLISGFILILSSFMMSRTKNWFEFLFWCGFVSPISVSMSFMPVIMVSWEWFPLQKGKITGIIQLFFGFSALIFGFLSKAIVNPNEEKVFENEELHFEIFDRSVADKVPKMYQTIGIVQACFFIVGILCISRPGISLDDLSKTIVKKVEKANDHIPFIENHNLPKKRLKIELSEALKNIKFWHISIMLFNGAFIGAFTTSVFKTIAIEHISDGILTLAGALASACSGFARFFWALMLDKFGFSKVLTAMMIIQTINSALIYQYRMNEQIYPLFVCISSITFGGMFSTFPTATTKIYGIKNGPKINSFVQFSSSFAALFGFILNQNLSVIGEQNIFTFGSILSGLNLLLIFFFDENPVVILIEEVKNNQKKSNQTFEKKEILMKRVVQPYKNSWFIMLKEYIFGNHKDKILPQTHQDECIQESEITINNES